MVQLVLPAEVERLGAFLEVIESFARDLGFVPKRIQKLILIMEEALLNVVKHAYDEEGTGEVEVRCWEDGERIFIEVRDRGRPFNPLDVPEPDLSKGLPERPIGGLGVFLIRKIADDVSYRREKETNVLTLVLRKEP
ncbi:MAG: ATP-binding protein [Thermodesulforhabdaceae bacterium]